MAALTVGWAVDNTTQTVLWRGLITLVICFPIGLIIGTVAQRVVDDNIAAYKNKHPITDESDTPVDDSDESSAENLDPSHQEPTSSGVTG